MPKALLPLATQRPERCPHSLRGQVGSLPFGTQQQEPAVLHDEFKPLHPLTGAPTDPEIPVLERITGRTPDQQSHRLAVQRNHLPKVVSDGAASSQVMMLPQLLVEPWDVFRRGDPNFQFSSTAAGRFKINRVFHPSLADLKTGFLSSPNFAASRNSPPAGLRVAAPLRLKQEGRSFGQSAGFRRRT